MRRSLLRSLLSFLALGAALAACDASELKPPPGAQLLCGPERPCFPPYVCNNAGRCVPPEKLDQDPPALAADATLSETLLGPGAELLLSFRADEPLGAVPVVSGKIGDTVLSLARRGEGVDPYTFAYRALGSEPEGEVAITIGILDVGGNAVEAPGGRFSLDFSGPRLVGEPASIDRNVGLGETVTISANVNEDLGGELSAQLVAEFGRDEAPAQAKREGARGLSVSFTGTGTNADGTYRVFASVRDPAGNPGRLDLGTLSLDTVGPKARLEALPEEDLPAGANVRLRLRTDEALAEMPTLELWRGESREAVLVAESPGDTEAEYPFVVPPGSDVDYEIRIGEISDPSGNTTPAQALGTLLVDGVPPALVAAPSVSPSVGRRDTPFTLTFRATETLAVPPDVSVRIGAASGDALREGESADPYTYIYRPSGTEPQGAASFAIRLRDAAGNVATLTPGVSVRLDFTPPALVPGSASVAPPYARQGTTLVAAFTATEPLGEAALVSLAGVLVPVVASSEGNRHEHRLTIDSRSIALGSESLQIVSAVLQDEAGNISEPLELGATRLDFTAPAPDVSGLPTASVSAGWTIAPVIDFGEEIAGEPAVTLAYGGATLATLARSGATGTTVSYVATVPVTDAGGAAVNGPVSLHVAAATDRAGNASAPKTLGTFLVDGLAPSGSVALGPDVSLKAGDVLDVTVSANEPVRRPQARLVLEDRTEVALAPVCPAGGCPATGTSFAFRLTTPPCSDQTLPCPADASDRRGGQVLVTLTDVAGNVGTPLSAGPVTLDREAPVASGGVTATPSVAGVGQVLTLRVISDETLSASATTCNDSGTGACARFFAPIVSGSVATWTRRTAVVENESPLGAFTLVLADLAGNTTPIPVDGNALVDATRPNFAVVASVESDRSGAGATWSDLVRVQLRRVSGEPLPGLTSTVALGPETATAIAFSTATPQSGFELAWTGRVAVPSTPPFVFKRPLTVTLADVAGNRTTQYADVSFDFAAPKLVSGSDSVEYVPGACDVSSGLGGRWSFEGESSDGLVRDDVQQRPLEAYNAVAPVPGRFGKAYLAGEDGAFLFSDHWSGLPLGKTAGATLAAWVRLRSHAAGTASGVAAIGGAGCGEGLVLGIDSGKLYASFGADPSCSPVTGATVAANEWHHVAVTWDGQSRRLFLDGRLVGTDTPVAPSLAEGRFRAGIRSDPFETQEGVLDGALDDLRVYAAALTPAAVAGLAVHGPTAAGHGSGYKAAAVCTRVTVRLALDEVPSSSGVTLTARQGSASFAFGAPTLTGSSLAFTTLVGDPSLPGGDYALELQTRDLTGNFARLAGAEGPSRTVRLDLVRPDPLPVDVAGRVIHDRKPWGGAAGEARSQSVVVAANSSAESDAVLEVLAGPSPSSQLLGSAAASSGSIVTVPVEGVDRARVWISLVDAAGNVSDAAEVLEGKWLATLGGKLPGRSVENPNALVSTTGLGPSLVQSSDTATEPDAATYAAIAKGAGRLRTDANGVFSEVPAGATLPPPRVAAVYAWDPIENRALLQGGGGSSFLSDTWELRGRIWKRLAPAKSPNGGTWRAGAYDAARRRLVMFGANGGGFGNDDVTWEFDGTNWTCFYTAGTSTSRILGCSALAGRVPPARSAAGMVWDAKRRRIVMFGGHTHTGVLNDTWEWDGSAWVETCPSSSCGSPPAARSHLSFTYDARRGRSVLFGGQGWFGPVYGDTWEFDGARWTQAAPAVSPPARAAHAATWDPAREAVVLHGGRTSAFVPNAPSAGDLSDLWSFDGTTWTGVCTGTCASASPVRGGASMVGGSDGILRLFGGDTAAGLAAASHWEWIGTRWRQTPGTSVQPPGSNTKPATFFDESRGVTSFVGGTLADGTTAAQWYDWDGVAWANRTADLNGMPARQRAAATWVSVPGVHAYGLVFGGLRGTALNDTWYLFSGVWLPWTSAPTPPNRADAMLAYDPVRGKAVLFGGVHHDASSCALERGDTWEWDALNGGWTQVCTSAACLASVPQARHAGVMGWDAKRGRIVLTAGEALANCNTTWSVLRDTWEWDGARWTVVTGGELTAERSDSSLLGLVHAAMSPDASGKLLLFGGMDVGTSYHDALFRREGIAWTNLRLTSRPSKRHSASMAYDSLRKRSVLYGGTAGNELWEWDARVDTRPGALMQVAWGDALLSSVEFARVDLRGVGEGAGGGVAGLDVAVWNPSGGGAWEWAAAAAGSTARPAARIADDRLARALIDSPGTNDARFSAAVLAPRATGTGSSANVTIDGASAQVSTCRGGCERGLRLSYFAGRRPSGVVVSQVRATNGIDVDWGSGAPAAGVPSDGFTAVWEGSVRVQAEGSYGFSPSFAVASRKPDDEHGRIVIDGVVVGDTNGGSWGWSATLAEGWHDVRVEVRDDQGPARAAVRWWGPDTHFASEIFGSRAARGPRADCTGCAGGVRTVFFEGAGRFTTPLTVRNDSAIDFAWSGAPGTSLPADDFSVRVDGEVRVDASGTYGFHLSSAGGGRVLVDGQVVVNDWVVSSPHGEREASGSIALTPGWHAIVVEAFDTTGASAARLRWTPPGGAKVTVPSENLRTPWFAQ